MVTFTSLFRLLPLLSLSTTAVSHPVLNDAVFNAASTHTVYQYPLGTWVENIAVRRNGNLLVTFTQPTPSLHEINPSHPPNTTADPAATLLHTFTNHTQLTGISELAPDVFAVIADNSVYRVDLSAAAATNDTAVPITLIANLSTAGLLNGMATLPATTSSSSSPSLLISDSELGLVWHLDPRTGAHAVFLQHNATMSPADFNGLFLGINGLRYVPPSSSSSSYDNSLGYAYYVNSPRRVFCRVPVDPATGKPAGAVEVVASGLLTDDFAVRREGEDGNDEIVVGYLAGLNDNVVRRVEESGRVTVVAGGLNSTAVAGATSAAFGKTEGWKDTLFVTTGGASAAPVNGTYVEGGKVVAVKLGF